MATRDVPLDSDALRANIAGTKHDIEVPERFRNLLAAVDGLRGVREPLREMLEEYHHPFRNVDAVLDGLQTTLLRNWDYFERSSDRAAHFVLISGLALGLAESPLDDERTSRLLRLVLTWADAAARGPHGQEHAEGIAELGRSLASLLPDRPLPFLERDRLFRRLLESLSAAAGPHPGLQPWLHLYRSILRAGYERAGERLDVAGWAASGESRLADGPAAVAHFQELSRERMRALAADLNAGTAGEATGRLLSLPSYSHLLDEAVGSIHRVDHLEDRFNICLFFLKDDTLGYRQHDVMVELLGVVKTLMDPARHTDFDRVLHSLTSFFHRREGLYPEMRYQCYEAIGTAIGEAGATRAADRLIEDLLAWRFQYPDVRGATDEWQTLVNPYHLPNVRCWMRIIESNPALYDRLAAALDAQLRAGGVFIADTDLFQRDVTRFLNADIKPIYFAAKQLLRTFPVYFNEVGAEGELRSVSTEIDEVMERGDTLMHFLRKQVHAESSNRLVEFAAAVLEYWRTLDTAPLEPFLSPSTLAAVRAERGLAEGPHAVLTGAAPPDGRTSLHRRRVRLMTRLQRLLEEKYSLSAGDLGERVSRHLRLPEDARARFAAALGRWPAGDATPASSATPAPDAAPAPGATLPAADATPARAAAPAIDATPARAAAPAIDAATARDTLLDAALTVLEELRAVILEPTPSEGVENIYHKRHIAAGIPSMYGDYSEPKFDALGLSFRVEHLVGRLLEDAAAEEVDGYVTRASLRRMSTTLRRFERALRVDGVHSQSLSANLHLLEASFDRAAFTFQQYHNIFLFLARAVSDLTRISTLSHDQALRSILRNDPRQCERRGLAPDAVAEVVLREVLVSALGLQTLDRFVSAALRRLSTLAGRLGAADLTRIMNYDPDRLVATIHEPDPATDDQITLGYKALGLKHLAEFGYRVPRGFILTTELFAVMPALSHRPLYDDTISRIREALTRLENATGLRLGDPERLLTLSIRSGAAVSMPGLMMTFINVGLNEEIIEGLARGGGSAAGRADGGRGRAAAEGATSRPEAAAAAPPAADAAAEPGPRTSADGHAWTAWDSYRRFLQSWAMSAGVERDLFDGIMAEAKARHGVEHKSELTPAQMRETALVYRAAAVEQGVVYIDDPFQQVIACIKQVITSWESPQARLYRQYVEVAEEWGTAVIVQRMVLGNRDAGSGSGVVFTRNPLEPHSRQVRLFGDFAVRSQGEDLVGGLVFPLPISEAQRRGSATYQGVESSLEKDFPEIYRELVETARDLVFDREYDPQEIEFTFESPAADDLYYLQKRPMVLGLAEEPPVFDLFDCAQCDLPVAVGMGVAGGAYAGRAATTMEQIDRLLAEDAKAPIVLLRPDTVPEDLSMILRVDGILTARGGATSHAAVTAKRLGKTAIVDCRVLEVVEAEGRARLAGRDIAPGDWLSIDGSTGRVFLGRLDIIRPPSTPAGPTAGARGRDGDTEEVRAR